MTNKNMKKELPSMDQWLKEAKADPVAPKEGMYLMHNGVVRERPKGEKGTGDDSDKYREIELSYDAEKVDAVIDETSKMEGIFHVRVWLDEGDLKLGDDIVYALVGGDTRANVIKALQSLLANLRNKCVTIIEKQ